MQNSLIIQSRQLLEKLNHQKFPNSSENKASFDELLVNNDNLRCHKHSLSDSVPKSAVNSILSRSAYLSKSIDNLSNVSSLTDVTNIPKRIPFGVPSSADQMRTLSSDKCNNLQNLDLLGYDWIAGMMENKAKESQLDLPQEYFEELERFRRQNKQYCISTENRQPSNTAYISQKSGYKKAFNDFSYDFQSKNVGNVCEEPSECLPEVFAYTLNERLFPIPLDMETAQRGAADPNNPHIIKISIPSNRFIHRNHKVQTLKEKNSVYETKNNTDSIGESLSLSSHCLSSRGASLPAGVCQSSLVTSGRSHHQEPASLRGHIMLESEATGGLLPESMSPFGGNQPRNEQEAIDQLQRGKTGAKLSRMVPSTLMKRSLNIEEVLGESMNICQTRITLKDMDDSQPRSPFKTFSDRRISESTFLDNNIRPSSPVVPRASLSRKQMHKVYGDAMTSVWQAAEERS